MSGIDKVVAILFVSAVGLVGLLVTPWAIAGVAVSVVAIAFAPKEKTP